METRTGDALIERIRTHPADDDIVGPAAHHLLTELYAGYPVENLGRLLHSDDETVAGTGAWLLAELTELAAPMMDEIPALLAHRNRIVRHYAIAVVLDNAGERHGPAIAQVIGLSEDPESAIRWKVLDFLAGASLEQLEAGAACLPAGPLRDLTEWLVLQEDEEPDLPGIVRRLTAGDAVTRLFAAAAAASLSGPGDMTLLEHAARAEEEEIRAFAEERLAELREDAASHPPEST
ncbi:hypothetical protein ACIBEJ_04400 [Nonomuraea sp. NPDC050790]|uniref:hypothetical protein n=1 Tax=Nonomuraea sp. NPDC050790 TaxID=3364371 RepID=UPI003794F200